MFKRSLKSVVTTWLTGLLALLPLALTLRTGVYQNDW